MAPSATTARQKIDGHRRVRIWMIEDIRARRRCRTRRRGTIRGMSNDDQVVVDPPTPTLPLQPVPVQTLEYFDEPDQGWWAATRLALMFIAAYAGVRVLSGIAYLLMVFGQGGGFSVYATAAWAVTLPAQVLVPAATLAASL